MTSDRTYDLAEVRQTLSDDAAGLRADLRRAEADGDHDEVARIERAMKTIEIDARLLARAEQREQRRRERAEEARLHLAGLVGEPPRIDVPEEGGPPARIERARIDLLLPLLPGPPSWRTQLSSVYGEDDERIERERADAIIALAVEEALATLTARPRAAPPRVVAMQVYDHHVARDEGTIPPHALDLLARAMRIDPRQITALERRASIAIQEAAGRPQKAIAASLGITPRALRLLRDRPPPADVALYAAIAEGHDLRALRPAVASALGLIDTTTGRWRADVLKQVAAQPERVERVLRGVEIDGKFHRARDRLPAVDPETADVSFIAEERVLAARGGVPDPDLVREAASVEAYRRMKRGVENNPDKVAAILNKPGSRVDPRTVDAWMRRDDWSHLVLCAAYDLVRRKG